VTLNREFERLFADSEPVACYWSDFSIALMPANIYEEFVQKLMVMPRDLKTQAYRNFFLANTSQMTIDTNHRITLGKQDLEFLRKGNGPGQDSTPTGDDLDWKEELVLSGLFNYIVIKTKKNAEKTLTLEQMVAYGEFLEQTACLMHGEGTVEQGQEEYT